jgi:3-oxoacyl-[acyl-carrier protein] reductase
MAIGLAEVGYRVLAAGHIAEDLAPMQAAARARGIPDEALQPALSDIRDPEACTALVEAARARFGGLHILVNNAGLTFTTISPDKFRRPKPQPFWECGDGLVQAVMDTNFTAADCLARRVVPYLLEQGWGRIINVTTKLDTMNRPGSSPYGPSKAALEMATEIWAKELAGTGVTANIVNPGSGANTPGMAEEWRAGSRNGTMPLLLEPEAMVAPLLFVVSDEANEVNGYRFDANSWDGTLPPALAARRNARPAGFVLHAAAAWDAAPAQLG